MFPCDIIIRHEYGFGLRQNRIGKILISKVDVPLLDANKLEKNFIVIKFVTGWREFQLIN